MRYFRKCDSPIGPLYLDAKEFLLDLEQRHA